MPGGLLEGRILVEVALALIQRKGRWLVSRRAPGRVFEGLWEFPGGACRPDELPTETASREALEEVGLAVRAVGSMDPVETAHAGQQFRLHLIRCAAKHGNARPSDPAIVEVRWVDLEELKRLPMPPANAAIVARIAAAAQREAQ